VALFARLCVGGDVQVGAVSLENFLVSGADHAGIRVVIETEARSSSSGDLGKGSAGLGCVSVLLEIDVDGEGGDKLFVRAASLAGGSVMLKALGSDQGRVDKLCVSGADAPGPTVGGKIEAAPVGLRELSVGGIELADAGVEGEVDQSCCGSSDLGVSSMTERGEVGVDVNADCVGSEDIAEELVAGDRSAGISHGDRPEVGGGLSGDAARPCNRRGYCRSDGRGRIP
jgi:hypothetical protein